MRHQETMKLAFRNPPPTDLRFDPAHHFFAVFLFGWVFRDARSFGGTQSVDLKNHGEMEAHCAPVYKEVA